MKDSYTSSLREKLRTWIRRKFLHACTRKTFPSIATYPKQTSHKTSCVTVGSDCRSLTHAVCNTSPFFFFFFLPFLPLFLLLLLRTEKWNRLRYCVVEICRSCEKVKLRVNLKGCTDGVWSFRFITTCRSKSSRGPCCVWSVLGSSRCRSPPAGQTRAGHTSVRKQEAPWICLTGDGKDMLSLWMNWISGCRDGHG